MKVWIAGYNKKINSTPYKIPAKWNETHGWWYEWNELEEMTSDLMRGCCEEGELERSSRI